MDISKCETCQEDCPQAQGRHDAAMGRMYAMRELAKCAPYWDALFDENEKPKITPDRLRELVEADRDGRCVVLPCPVGTTVYMPFCSGIVEKKIGQFHINGYTNPRIWADIDCDWATTQRVRWDLAFGKTVFLTREAAEAALKGEQHEKH